MTPSTISWKGSRTKCAGWAGLRTEVEENHRGGETVGDVDSDAGATAAIRLSWLDLFSPHGPWDPAPALSRPVRTASGPTSCEAGEEGDLVEDMEDAEIDLAEVAVLIARPRRRPVGDVSTR